MKDHTLTIKQSEMAEFASRLIAVGMALQGEYGIDLPRSEVSVSGDGVRVYLRNTQLGDLGFVITPYEDPAEAFDLLLTPEGTGVRGQRLEERKTALLESMRIFRYEDITTV